MLDLSRSPIEVPRFLRDVPYNAHNFPGSAAAVGGVEGGANCQQFAYSFLRHYGFVVPDFRSSDLWEDTRHTKVSRRMMPFDLVLVNGEPRSFGAHVGVCVGGDLVLHLSRQIGVPAIERLAELQRREEYRFLIGSKKVVHRDSSGGWG